MKLTTMKTRELVSFDGVCPYHCKHCYTYGLKEAERLRSAEEIVEDLEGKEFDVVYVSHNKENFVIPAEGIGLCEKLFERYKCNILVITRNVFEQDDLNRLAALNRSMRERGKYLFLAVSLPGLESIAVTEGLSTSIPAPERRIEFLAKAKGAGLPTILVIRPLYPDRIIPIAEPLELIERCRESVDCVLASGLAVNDQILQQLGFKEQDFVYVEDKMNEYLAGAIEGDVRYINVEHELRQIKKECEGFGLPFFEHSMFALDYLSSENLA